MVPSLSANPTRDESRYSPQYSSYGPISPVAPDRMLDTRAPSPAERSGSATIDRSLTSLSITSHVPGQRYASPIYSDPIYHTPRPQRFPHGSSTYSLPSPQDIGSSHGSWREGEAGPSSLVYPPARHERGRNRGSSQPAERTLPRIETESYLRRHGEMEEGTGSAIPRTSRVTHMPANTRKLSDRRFKPNSRTVRGRTFRASAPRGRLLTSLGEPHAIPTPCKHGLVLPSLFGQVVHQLTTHQVLYLKWPESHSQMTRLPMIPTRSKRGRKGSETLTRETIVRERTKIHGKPRLHAISVEVTSRPCQFLTSLLCQSRRS
jgi:hypothetical protein